MSSFRKKYQPQFESPSKGDEPPVLSPPVTGAKMSEAVESKPLEMPKTQSPADAAASSAIKDRLAEMERADQLTRQQQPPQPEPQPQPEMPAAVAKFLAENPRYSDPNDAIAQGEIYVATLKCNRDGKNWNDDDFVPHLQRHLGIAPATNGQAESRPPAPAPRYEAPPREPMRASPRQQYSAPVSAPPTREPPLMATGKPRSYRAPLTEAELEVARSCGQDNGISPEEYMRQKERM